ncbi:MAG: RNA polymerase sigma factor SigZ [Candidatus Thiodiazotropha sp. (ex Epidulcina cf. delphinae)]|nr:RNA polymerase sigma factor SigZ [Candidatus Thiodiazotropha sp. (ex Epidulcina cf. delphinae)]
MIENKAFDSHQWEEYRTMLYRFILKRVNEPAMAEDIVQDVLIKVYAHLNTLNDRGKILSWMYRITRNAIADHYRKYKPTEDFDKIMVINETHTEENAEKDLAKCLLPLVNKLPSNYQQAIKMTEFDGLTQKEVAQKQGLSLSGAKSRVQRGRKLLKERLMECCRIEFDRQGKVCNYECENC